MAIAALLFGLLGCTKENMLPSEHGEEASKAKLSLSLWLPTSATKATDGGDLNATTSESVVNSVHVFVFTAFGDKSEQGGYTSFDLTDFTSTGNTYTLNNSKNIETLSGSKRIYVGINLPNGSWRTYGTEDDLLAAFSTVANMTEDNNFTMFSDVQEVSLQSEEYLGKGVANNITVDIRRVTAKVAASSNVETYATTDWTETGLTMTYAPIHFRVIQDAKNSYVAPNYEEVDDLIREKTRIDDFSFDNRFNVLNSFAVSANAPSVTINHPHPGSDADLVAMGGVYVGENAPLLNVTGNTTYVMVATTVTCNREAEWDVTANGGLGGVVWNSANYGGGIHGSDVYVVHYNGNDYVCATYAGAEALGLGLDGNSGKSKIYTYTDGYVHFAVWLNKSGDNSYSVLRNQFIHVKVNGVTDREYFFPGYPGDPNDPQKPIDPTDPDNPDNPYPQDPEDPVDGMKTYLNVEVNVKPWMYKENDTILK